MNKLIKCYIWSVLGYHGYSFEIFISPLIIFYNLKIHINFYLIILFCLNEIAAITCNLSSKELEMAIFHFFVSVTMATDFHSNRLRLSWIFINQTVSNCEIWRKSTTMRGHRILIVLKVSHNAYYTSIEW